jgi:hypothetical protein
MQISNIGKREMQLASFKRLQETRWQDDFREHAWVCERAAPMPEKPRLLDRARDAIRTRHYSRRTEQAYIIWIKRFIHCNCLAICKTGAGEDR